MFVLLAIFGALMSISACIDLYRASHSASWPSTTGMVITSQAFRFMDTYKVNGVDYFGDRTTFWGPDHYAPEFDDCSVETSVVVYYNPNNPRLAVLKPGISWRNFAYLTIGLIFFGIGLVATSNNW